MRRVLLVTAREYRRILGLPAFWIISFLIPLIVAAAPLAQNLFGRSQTVGYVLVDKSGRYAAQINQRVDLDYQRQVLINLLVYAREWRDGSAAAASEGGLSTSHFRMASPRTAPIGLGRRSDRTLSRHPRRQQAKQHWASPSISLAMWILAARSVCGRMARPVPLSYRS